MAVSRTSTTDHAAHDGLLLAALASGDVLEPADRARADVLVRDCPECALLLADMQAIRSATADLPAPPRRRDFRLTDADAARLTPSGWRRILAGFGSPRARLTGPAALGLATLGIAGILFAAIPSAPLPGATTMNATGAGAAADTTVRSEPMTQAAPMELALPAASDAGTPGTERAAQPEPTDGKLAPEAPLAAGGPSGAPSTASPAPAALLAPEATVAPGAEAGGAAAGGSQPMTQAVPAGGGAADVAPPPADVSEGGEGYPWLVVGSILLLAAGLVLGGLRLAGTRVAGR